MERGWSSVSFGVLLIAALVAVPLSGSLLPAVVASHFGVHGEANGFMPRGSYLLLMTVFTVGVPLLMVGSVAWRARRGPDRLKLPNREHWLAPERRAQSVAYLVLHMARMGSLLILLMGYVQALVVRANLLQPPRMENMPLLAGVAVFLLVTLLWVAALHRRFGKPS